MIVVRNSGQKRKKQAKRVAAYEHTTCASSICQVDRQSQGEAGKQNSIESIDT